VDEIPFDFFRKKLSVVAEKGGKRLMVTKGAPEEVMKSCRCYHKDGACVPLDAESEKAVRDRYAALSREGYRVLAVASKEVEAGRDTYEKADEAGMEMLGFVSFLDPARAGLPGVLLRLRELGIAVKIITGDNELVTRKVCADVGLEIEATLAGPDAEAMDDLELRHAAERTTVFARFSPEQKNRVIAALRENGHTVGYMGDGINDAPSLRTADIGISVSNGVDVAKEAADMVLTEKSLEELVDGVLEGRKTFGNTMKYVMMGVGANFGNMFSVLGAVLFLPFLPMLPIQILLNNFLYDLSQVTIPGDRVDEEEIARPRSWDIGFIKKFMLVFGPLSSVFDFVTFFALAHAFPGNAAAFQTGWFLESIATQTLVIHVIRTRKTPFLESRPSLPLLVSTLAAVGIAWLLPWTPLGPLLQLVPLPGWALLAMAAIAFAYLAATELVKRLFYRWHERIA
jgi:Mg2+-importing ATPase